MRHVNGTTAEFKEGHFPYNGGWAVPPLPPAQRGSGRLHVVFNPVFQIVELELHSSQLGLDQYR